MTYLNLTKEKKIKIHLYKKCLIINKLTKQSVSQKDNMKRIQIKN